MLRFLLCAVLLAHFSLGQAQSYDVVSGVRLGTDIGMSIKMRVPPVDKNFTGELIFQQDLGSQDILLTVLAAQHMPIGTRRLNFYSGMGLHKGWLDRQEGEVQTKKDPFGLSLVGGFEINFKNLNVSADYKPTINLVGGKRVFQSSTALTVRYIVIKRHDLFTSPREKRKKQSQKRRKQKSKNKNSQDKKWWDVFGKE